MTSVQGIVTIGLCALDGHEQVAWCHNAGDDTGSSDFDIVAVPFEACSTADISGDGLEHFFDEFEIMQGKARFSFRTATQH